MSKSVPNTVATDTTQHDDEIDLIALLMTLLRGWKTIVACASLGLILGVTYSRYAQPTYQTDALIQIDQKSQGIAALGANISELVGAEASPAETERELIKSRMVLEPVVKQLHLDIRVSDAEINAFDRIAQAGIPSQSSTAESVTLNTQSGMVEVKQLDMPFAYQNKNFSLVKTESGFKLSHEDKVKGNIIISGKLGESVNFSTPEGDISIEVASLPAAGHAINIRKLSTPRAIDSLNSALSVTERGKQTGIVQLTMTGSNQTQVSRVLSEVVQSYVDQNLSRGSEQTTTTIKFMESQIPQLKEKLEQSEEAFNKFREQYGTIDVTKEAEILLTESSKLEQQLSELNLKKAELLTFYTNEHPLVLQINEQLNILNERRTEIKETIERMPEVQREFLQLSQDSEINREIYLTMLKNYEQLKIAHAGEIGYVRVVDTPINTYQPIAPKKLQIWVLSLLLGTMLGTLLVFIKSLLRNTVKDPERLEQKTGVPVLATIPRSKTALSLTKNNNKNRRLLAMVDHDGLSYEGIKSLRTSLMFAMPKQSKVASLFADSTLVNETTQQANKQGKVIIISGESPGIGKSFISSNLAETFSQLNKKVLIIDGDMRRGELHHIFTVPQTNGLGDYLTDKDATLANFIHPTSFEFIDFMPRGKHPSNPASLLSTDKFAQMLSQLVAIYDYVLIDTPPVLAVSDAIVTAQYADKVLMVTRYNHSVEGQLSYAIRQMHKAHIEVDGIVLNDVVQSITSKYSYHYSYAYSNTKD
ncbi:polysaccharide biosynthesis tyrosine autokinase [Psychrobacter sp. FDAARGOS_221]|uniref:polysaccharide biosynthesis tyrosine autokinase n=1 Tax=Psychrobacter sp. FDAARGOS_221 TaxID=1975705 RepID=UPI000BB5788D|nr:polysaccharide biosynthesis tyrosine autokinase [Psychrobacter sp. FDAARGOS_221]PNK60499.1 lipopolysaccharide biosynthesis protein [Psychrobacter sp. FDAARGOS_221]